MLPNDKLKVTEMQCLSCKNMIPAGLEKCDVCGKIVSKNNPNIVTKTTHTIVHNQKNNVKHENVTILAISGTVAYILGFFFRWNVIPISDSYFDQIEAGFFAFTIGTMLFFLAILSKE